ncbi:hypothetical protein PTKIN_Ptkin09bG0034800 [Pterospermum kingtungense]
MIALLLFLSSRRITDFTLITESDSTVGVSWANNLDKVPWRLRHFSNHIENLKLKVPGLKISHIFKEGNTIADRLAKEGVNRETDLLVVFN